MQVILQEGKVLNLTRTGINENGCPVSNFREKRFKLAVERLNDELPTEQRTIYSELGEEERITAWDNFYEATRLEAAVSFCTIEGREKAAIKALNDRLRVEKSLSVIWVIRMVLDFLGQVEAQNSKSVVVLPTPILALPLESSAQTELRN